MAGLLSEEASNFAAGWTSVLTTGKLEEPEYSSTNWYFTRDEIEKNSPSRKDGVDVKKETYFRKSYCTFLQDLGMRLKVPQVTIATAIVMCHRFFLRQSHARNDKFMVGTVCMFLAGKVEETPRPLRDVIILSYELRNKKDPVAAQRIRQKDVFEDEKELLLLGERLVLTTLEFDMNIHHPYKPLVTAIKRFKVAQVALAQVAWNFVNDGLRTSLCLQFKPHHIAAGAIFLATKFLRVKLPFDGEKVWWHEFDVTPRQLEDVSNQMLELYEQNKAGSSSRASDLSVSAGGCNGYKTEVHNLEVPSSANGVSQASPIGSFNATHDEVLPGNADAAPSKHMRPESQGDMIVRKDEIYGHRKPNEENRLLEDHLKGGAQKSAEINQIRKDDDGKRRSSLNLHEAETNAVKAFSEKKRKSKVGAGENLFGVKEEVALKSELLLREPENAVEVAAGPDMSENRRSHLPRGNMSSLEIGYDAEVESWSSAKRKKLADTGQPYHNTKGKRDYDKGNVHRTNMQVAKSYEGMADQIEEGEFGLQKQNYFSKVSNEEHIAPDTFGKASGTSEQMFSQQLGMKEGPSEKKHWHGKNQASLSSGYHQLQNSDRDINRHQYKDQVWEQDSKKIRRDHLK